MPDLLHQLDSNRPCLVLAPHLVFPTRTGSNIAIYQRWSAYSRFVPYVDIIGQNTIIRYENGQAAQTKEYTNPVRTKKHAAIRTILSRSQYQLEKFVTPEFSAEAERLIANSDYGLIVGSYLYSVPLLKKDPHLGERLHLVETHNDDFKWYRTLREAATNPVAKLIARMSEQWTAGIVQECGDGFLLSHVTEADREGYAAVAPNHQSIITPIGVAIPDQPPIAQPPLGDLRLLFVGSLGVMMNADALAFFGRTYFPVLEGHFGEDLAIDVVGNSPSEFVKRICEEKGWNLYPNAPDKLLHELLHKASFTLLPFEYATGAKLKLLESVAHGVPFLATSHVLAQLDVIPPSCLLANEPKDWLEHVKMIHEKGQSIEDRRELVEIAKQHSWEASARGVFERLTQD